MISDFSALIYSQVCGIFVSIVLLVLYILQKKLPIRNGFYFLVVLLTTLLCNIVDVISVLLNTYLPTAFVTLFFAKLYLVIMCISLMSVTLYITNDVLPKKQYYVILKALLVLSIVLCIIMAVTKIEVVDVYTKGIGVTLTFVNAGFIIMFNVIFALKHKKDMAGNKGFIILIWMLIWTVLAGIQFLFPKFLLVSFGLSLGSLIIYIKLENLGTYIDEDTGLFNYPSYNKYLNDLKFKGKKTSVIYIKASNLYSIGENLLNDTLNRFNILLNKRSDIFVFSSGYDYIIVPKGDNIKEIERWLNEIRGNEYIVGSHFNAIFIHNASLLENVEMTIDLVQKIISKNAGSERYLFYVNENELEQYLKDNDYKKVIESAIEDDRVVVYYQPIYSIDKKKITTAEALVRIVDENNSLVLPGAFIPVAEATGLISKLDEVVFEKVCKFISEHDMEKLGIEYIEINVSALQFSSYKMASNYITIAKKYNIDPKYINLEVTESTNVDYYKPFNFNIKKLISYGFTFSLDDFGTGYSNLSNFTMMPVEIIKFDKKMTDSYSNGEKGKFVMQYTMGMFKQLGYKIVVEGVENENQLIEMEKCKADYIQGYYFSKPIAENEFLKFLCVE